MNESALINRVWNYAHVLRRQGIPFGDYIEQITYLLFLKMDEEREALLGEGSAIPDIYRWHCLKALDGDDLESRYRKALEALSREKGLMGQIQTTFETRRSASFANALNKNKKLRVNRISEVHCRQRKRREEREIGPYSSKAGSTAQSEKSFVSRDFSDGTLVAEKPDNGSNWRREGNYGLTVSGP